MRKILRIGIVGLGNISGIHAQAIHESKNCELVSAYSRNTAKLEGFVSQNNIVGYTDWNKFISDKGLDAVAICTPNGTHLDYGKKAANAKKHIIVEKPIEVSIERANELTAICDKNNVSLAVIYQNRFIDKIAGLKQLILENKLGRLIMGDAYVKWFRSQDYYDSGEWRGTIALDGGGVLINQAIHTIDLLQWFMGDVDSVFGQAGTFSHQLEGEDNAVGTLRFKNGAIGVIQASSSVQPAQARRLEIHGEKGSIVIDGDDVRVFIEGVPNELEKKREEKIETAGSSNPMGGFKTEAHKKQFEAIANAFFNKEQAPVSSIESIKSLAIVLALYQSAKTNLVIKLDDFVKLHSPKTK